MTTPLSRVRQDFEEGQHHPRDVAYRVHVPFEDLMAMWRGEKPVDPATSAAIARVTGRRSDYYVTIEAPDVIEDPEHGAITIDGAA